MHKLVPFRNAEEITFKEGFVKRYSALTDWEIYKKYSLSYLRKSIRVNTLKISVEEMKERISKNWVLEQVPWCTEGFWVTHKEGRLDIGNSVEHVLGYYYVQEAASMIPPIVLDPQPGDAVLDLCAAPGSKTTQLAQYMKNKGVLVANDITGDRLASLGINCTRVGAANVIITQQSGERFAGNLFDKILVDAPCSGTGTIRKSLKTIMWWNPNMIKRLSVTQKRLMANAYTLLKPGGTLVYSTCSSEPDENEGVIDDFLAKNPDAKLEEINLNLKHGPAVQEFEGKTYSKEIQKCLRLWPQDNDTEGFFVAKIRKT